MFWGMPIRKHSLLRKVDYMEIKLYSYGNIVRILWLDPEVVSNSLMVDVDIDKKRILSLFDAERKFDADFIQSYLNILRESSVGFRLLADSEEDLTLRAKALNILGLNSSAHHKIAALLALPDVP